MVFGEHSLEGEVSQSLSTGKINGKSDSSFLDEGVNFVTEANLRYQSLNLASWGDWAKELELSSEVTVRKTDDAQVDSRRDLHLLYLNTKLVHPNFDIEFGDVYSQFTPMVLNRSLEGTQTTLRSLPLMMELKSVFARALQAEEGIQNSRYVIGQQLQKSFLNERFNIAANWIYNFDSAGSTKNEGSGIEDISNLVWSLEFKMKPFQEMNNQIEIGRSVFTDHNSTPDSGDRFGTAIKLKNDYRLSHFLGYSQFYFDYERADPDFKTDSGSMAVDREAVYVRLNHRFGRRLRMDASFREYHNNLEEGSSTTLRTKNPSFKIDLYPFSRNFEFFEKIRLRTQYDFRENQTGDRSVGNHTHDFGLALSNRYKIFDVQLRWDYLRTFDFVSTSDRANHLLGFRFGLDYRYDYFQISPYVDMTFRLERNFEPSQRDTTRDLRWGINLTVLERFRLNTAYGYLSVDRAAMNEDSVVETFLIDLEWDIHPNWMLTGRYDRRNNNFQEPSNDYGEDIGEIRLVYRF